MDIHCNISKDLTELCSLVQSHGSDKGGINQRHKYTYYYHNLFCSVKNDPVNVFELGIGSTNLNYRYNMGVNGKPGASLRVWRDFFPQGHIFGADIDKDILFTENRITTFYCDQGNANSIQTMWSNDILNAKEFDIIIDDGCHEIDYNVKFLENSFHKIKSSGCYIIEDTTRLQLDFWESYLADFCKKNNAIFRIVQIENAQFDVDILIVLQKK